MSAPKPDPGNKVDERLRRILDSPSYRLADRDLEFLADDEARANRLALEYLKPETLLRRNQIVSTVVVFGSARIIEPAAAQRRLDAAQLALEAEPDEPAVRAQVVVAKRLLAWSRYYDVARDLGRITTAAGQCDGQCEYVIVTGGGPGIMEGANRGAFDAGGKSAGLNIHLPYEQYPNPYISPELCFQFRYFALRKLHFLRRAKALVAFPGGYGTFDELFDALCLIQTGKITPLPVVLVGEHFWRQALNVDFLVEQGVIDASDARIFTYAETAEEIWARIRGV